MDDEKMSAALPQQVYQNLTLPEAESHIEGNLITTARAYVATGYFLKRIRNDRLYEEDGYKNFDEYIRAKYGKGKDWASRAIKVNNKLSVGGDSPYLGEEYKGYTTYQLVELAYMTEEQREQATPEQTVKELREIRRPKEIPYFEIEGQLDFETSFPEVMPEPAKQPVPPQEFTMSVEDMVGEEPEKVATSQQPESAAEMQQKEPESCEKCSKVVATATIAETENNLEEITVPVFTSELSNDSAYGWTWDQVVKAYLAEVHKAWDSQEDRNFPEAVFSSYGREYQTSVKEKQVAFLMDGEVQFIVNMDRLNREYDFFYSAKKEELSAYGTEKRQYPPDSLIATPGCKGGHDCFSCAMECQIRQADRYCREAPMGNPFPCEHIVCGLKAMQEEIGDRCQFINHDLADHCAGSGEADPCCKNCADPCEYICARAMKKLDEQQEAEEAAAAEKGPDESWNIGELPQAGDRYLKKLAEILAEAKGIQMVVNRSDSYLSEDTIKSNLEMLAEQYRGSIDIGDGAEAWPSQEMIEFCAGEEDLGVCSYVRFANHVRKVMKTWTLGTESKPEENVIDPGENVIDAEFTEVTDTEEYTAQYFLQEQQQKLNEMLEVFKDEDPEKLPKRMIARQKIIVAALAAMVCDLEEAELQKQMQWPWAEQPELPAMRNNDQRKEFLETFHDWPVWFRVPEASEVYYRYDLPDRTALVICEYKYYAAWMENYKNRYSDMNPEQTETREYLLTPGYHYLHDCQSNRSTMVEKLKEIQKRG